jgi:hypothetical protein
LWAENCNIATSVLNGAVFLISISSFTYGILAIEKKNIYSIGDEEELQNALSSPIDHYFRMGNEILYREIQGEWIALIMHSMTSPPQTVDFPKCYYNHY